MIIIDLKVPCRCWEGERMVDLKELDKLQTLIESVPLMWESLMCYEIGKALK